MGFEMIVSHMEFESFTYFPTFHHTSIRDHDLKVVRKIMGFFYHSLVNEIVSIAIVN
jgi:hypothetical protein